MEEDLKYEKLTMRNVGNIVTHDDCLVQIMAAPDFLPRLQEVNAQQFESIRFN